MTDLLQKPAVRLLIEDLPTHLQTEVLAGLEEEGVPAQQVPGVSTDLTTDAHAQAKLSRLGVALTAVGDRACLHMARLPVERAVFVTRLSSPEEWRLLGHDAARVVKSLPLYLPGRRLDGHDLIPTKEMHTP